MDPLISSFLKQRALCFVPAGVLVPPERSLPTFAKPPRHP
jgi:hypothetical protein